VGDAGPADGAGEDGADGLPEVDGDGREDEGPPCDWGPVLGVHPTSASVATAAASVPTTALPRVRVLLPNPLQISIPPEHTEGPSGCKWAPGRGRPTGRPTRV